MNIIEIIADVAINQFKTLNAESQVAFLHLEQTVNDAFMRLPLKYAMDLCFPQSYTLTETFNGYRVEVQLPQNCEPGAPLMNTVYSRLLKESLGENTTLTVMLTKDPERVYTAESKFAEFAPTHSVLKGDEAEFIFTLEDIANSKYQKFNFAYRSEKCDVVVTYTH